MSEKIPQKEYYKKIHPEQFSDTITIDKVDCPKDYLNYQIEHLAEQNGHFDFENFVKKLIERTICPNLIEETGPAPGGDGKVDTENYPVSSAIQERFYFGENEGNDRWAFAVSLRKDWKTKANEDIKKLINTKRDYKRIFIVTGCAIKNRDREKYQDEASTKELKITILDKTWIVDKALKPDNLDLLKIIHINQTIKEVIIGKNDYAKKEKIKELEDRIKKEELTFSLVQNAIESANLSRALEDDSDFVFGKYNRAYELAEKINSDYLKAQVKYNEAWYCNYWLEDVKKFNKYFAEFSEITEDDNSLQIVEWNNNLWHVSMAVNFNNPKLCDEQYNILKVKINNLINSQVMSESLMGQTLDSLNEVLKGNNIDDEFKRLLSIVEKAKKYKEYDFLTVSKLVKIMLKIFDENELFIKLYDNISDWLSIRTKDVESAKMIESRANLKFEKEQYQDAIVLYGKCLTLFYKQETTDYLFDVYCHLGLCFNAVGLINASLNYLVSAVTLAFDDFKKYKTLPYITMSIIRDIVEIEIIFGHFEDALLWYQLLKYIYTILHETGYKLDEKEIELYEDKIEANLIFLALHSDFDSYCYLLRLLPFVNQLGLSYLALVMKYVADIATDDEYKEIGESKEQFESEMKQINKTGFDAGISKPIFYDGKKITLETKVAGNKVKISFNNFIETMRCAEFVLSQIENLTVNFIKYRLFPRMGIIIDLNCNPKADFSFDYKMNTDYTFSLTIDGNAKMLIDNQVALKTKMLEFTSYLFVSSFVCTDIKKILDQMMLEDGVFERGLNHTNIIFNEDKLFGSGIELGEPLEIKRTVQLFIENKKMVGDEKIDYRTMVEKVENGFDEKNTFENLSHQKVFTSDLININLWDAASWNGVLYMYSPLGMFIGFNFENYQLGLKLFDDLLGKIGHEDNKGELLISFVKGISKTSPFNYAVCISSKVFVPNTHDNYLIENSTRYRYQECTNNKNLRILEDYLSRNGTQNLYLIPSSVINGKYLYDLNRKIRIKNIRIIDAYKLKLSDYEQVVIHKDMDIIIPNEYDRTELDKIIANRK